MAVAATQVAGAAENTSAETKARMIQLINKLETEPFTKDGKEIRGEVLTWLTEAPDVSVRVCANMFGNIKKIKSEEGGTLVVQLMFSEAKFILEHPEKAADQRAVNVAGVEGVLRTYAAMQAVNPKLSIREFDQLAQLQASGQLAAEVESRLATCQ
jgi:hypothetical protein